MVAPGGQLLTTMSGNPAFVPYGATSPYPLQMGTGGAGLPLYHLPPLQHPSLQGAPLGSSGGGGYPLTASASLNSSMAAGGVPSSLLTPSSLAALQLHSMGSMPNPHLPPLHPATASRMGSMQHHAQV